ncbi:MAG TPA: hypothetical protein VFH27_03540 [Longimicrobiaceae bacterium]|nr:hypothetical protein [Longimicrobiaceae bacterium]
MALAQAAANGAYQEVGFFMKQDHDNVEAVLPGNLVRNRTRGDRPPAPHVHPQHLPPGRARTYPGSSIAGPGMVDESLPDAEHADLEKASLWIEDDGLLRDEGAVFGLSAGAESVAQKEACIGAYFRRTPARMGH